MHKVVVSFLGRDCPGVVCAVASLLNELDCNIDEVSQTILHSEFAAIVIVSAPDSVSVEAIHEGLVDGLAKRNVDLNVTARAFDGACWDGGETEPFVVTVNGPDRPGLIAIITGIFEKYNVNIENLKALMPEADDDHALIVYELAMPVAVDASALRKELMAKGEELGVRVSMQHREIFEAVHRVAPV